MMDQTNIPDDYVLFDNYKKLNINDKINLKQNLLVFIIKKFSRAHIYFAAEAYLFGMRISTVSQLIELLKRNKLIK